MAALSGIGPSTAATPPASPDGISPGRFAPIGFIDSPGSSTGDGSADGTDVVLALQSLEQSVVASGNLALAAILSALAGELNGIVTSETSLRNDIKSLNDQETGQQTTLQNQQNQLAQDQDALNKATDPNNPNPPDPKVIKQLQQQVQSDKDAITKTQGDIAQTQGKIQSDTNQLSTLQSLLEEVASAVSVLSRQLAQSTQKQAIEGQTDTVFTNGVNHTRVQAADSLQAVNAGQRHSQRISFADNLHANEIQSLIDRAAALNRSFNSPAVPPASGPSRVRIPL